MKRPNPMHPLARKLVQTIAAAGKDGMSRAAIDSALPEDDQRYKRLANLVTLGYLRKDGRYSKACFVATGKQPPECDGKWDAEDLMRAEARDKTPKGVPPGVPNSVFHMGQLAGGVAAGNPSTTEGAEAFKPSTGAILAVPQWNAPQPSARIEPDTREYVVPVISELKVAPKPAPAAEPRFELHSDGVLLIDPAGDGTEPIALQPTVTRRLFRWLDQIGGLRLSRLVEQGAEATS